jgi:hypothetical protein
MAAAAAADPAPAPAATPVAAPAAGSGRRKQKSNVAPKVSDLLTAGGTVVQVAALLWMSHLGFSTGRGIGEPALPCSAFFYHGLTRYPGDRTEDDDGDLWLHCAGHHAGRYNNADRPWGLNLGGGMGARAGCLFHAGQLYLHKWGTEGLGDGDIKFTTYRELLNEAKQLLHLSSDEVEALDNAASCEIIGKRRLWITNALLPLRANTAPPSHMPPAAMPRQPHQQLVLCRWTRV